MLECFPLDLEPAKFSILPVRSILDSIDFSGPPVPACHPVSSPGRNTVTVRVMIHDQLVW